MWGRSAALDLNGIVNLEAKEETPLTPTADLCNNRNGASEGNPLLAESTRTREGDYPRHDGRQVDGGKLTAEHPARVMSNPSRQRLEERAQHPCDRPAICPRKGGASNPLTNQKGRPDTIEGECQVKSRMKRAPRSF
jgi:hypothetical protein